MSGREQFQNRTSQTKTIGLSSGVNCSTSNSTQTITGSSFKIARIRKHVSKRACKAIPSLRNSGQDREGKGEPRKVKPDISQLSELSKPAQARGKQTSEANLKHVKCAKRRRASNSGGWRPRKCLWRLLSPNGRTEMKFKAVEIRDWGGGDAPPPLTRDNKVGGWKQILYKVGSREASL